MTFRKIQTTNLVSSDTAFTDPLLVLNKDGTVTTDVGFLGRTGTNTYTGLVRDSDTNKYILIDSIDVSNQSSNDISATDASLTKATLEIGTLNTENFALSSTDAGSSAGPDFILYRDSASPTSGDYIGQIQFKGKNSNGGDEIYAKVTGKISDSTLGSEDGLIETAIKGNGSFTIVSRQKSDELQLLNGTGLDVAGNVTVGGDFIVNGTVTGISNSDVGLSNISDAGYGIDINGKLAISGDIDMSHGSTLELELGTVNFSNSTVVFNNATVAGLDHETVGLDNIENAAYGVNVTGKVAATDGLEVSVGGTIDAQACTIDLRQSTVLFNGATVGGLDASVSTSVSQPSNPSAGDLWFDTSVDKLYVYNSNSVTWVNVSDLSNYSIQDLSDIDSVDTPAASDMLLYDGATWGFVNYEDEINTRISANNAGLTAIGLSDIGHTGDTVEDGDFLLYDLATGKFGFVNFQQEVVAYANSQISSTLSSVNQHIIPASNITFDLGSPTKAWRDIYVGPGSLYVNGKKVLEDDSDTITFSTDANQDLRITTHGTGSIELFTQGTGNIQVKSTLQMEDGKKITNSAGNPVQFGDKIDMDNNQIVNMAAPTADGHAANKTYVDTLVSNIDLSAYATQTYVDSAVAGVVDSAPGTLNTLNELAAALGDDENFATTMTTSLAAKADITYVDTQIANNSGGSSVTVSSTAPSNPSEGDMWWDDEDGLLNVYYDGAWVEASPASSSVAQGAGSGLDADLLDGIEASGFYQTGVEISVPTLRITSNTDASATSTGHGFQVGDTTGNNIIIDNNEMLARDNGVISTLHFQADGGKVIFGNNTVNKVTIEDGEITATGDVTAYSDDSLKTNVQTITGALSKVEQVTGVTFDRISDGSTSTGVIAQELEAVLPEAVKTDDAGLKHVAYGNITGLLIEAVKELDTKYQNQIKELQNQIKELKRNG